MNCDASDHGRRGADCLIIPEGTFVVKRHGVIWRRDRPDSGSRTAYRAKLQARYGTRIGVATITRRDSTSGSTAECDFMSKDANLDGAEVGISARLMSRCDSRAKGNER